MRLHLALVLLLSISVSQLCFAGGPILVQGELFKWSGAVNLIIDGGPLGTLTNQQALALVQGCISEWDRLPSSTITFPSQLSDVDFSGATLGLLGEKALQGLSTVVFDSNGSLIDELYGAGASDIIMGSGGIVYIYRWERHFYSGRVILNGRFSADPNFRRAVLHEFGHLAGLDHSQAGFEQAESPDLADNARIAVMFPLVLPGCSNNLQQDDISWISWMYPDTKYTGGIGIIWGVVKKGNGTARNDVHVVAEKMEDDQPGEMVSCFSGLVGSQAGAYELPYLPPGTYAVYIEPAQIFSALGGFPKDYYNGEQESGLDSDNVNEKVLLTINAGGGRVSAHLFTNDGYSLPLPNLTAAAPPEGWSSSLIATNQPGSTEGRSSFELTDSVFVSWAVANTGNVPTAAPFTVKLLLDGVEAGRWDIESGLKAGATTQRTDIPLGVLQRGIHVLRLLIDTESQVGELDEQDNAGEISLTIGNNLPTVTVGPNQSVKKGVVVTLSGSGTDPDGDAVSYEWLQVQGPPVILLNSDKPIASFISPGLAADTDLVFQLTVRDSWGGEASAAVTVSVQANIPPFLRAGGTIAATPGDTVYLTASALDQDADPLVFAWSQTAGTPVTLKKANEAIASFTAPPVTGDEELRFVVGVTDGVANPTSEVLVLVQPSVFTTLSVPYGFHGTGFDNSFLGVALFNDCAVQNEVEAIGSDSSGNQTFQLTMPAPLPGFGQSTFLASDVGDADPETETLKLGGKNGSLKGFFMLGDYAMERLDGVGSEPQAAKKLILPICSSGPVSTQFFLRNDLSGPVEARVRMRGMFGQVLRDQVVELAGGSIRALTPEELWDDLPEGEGGYVEVNAQTPLSGFQTITTDTGYAAVAANVPEIGKRLYMPHFYADAAGGNTELRLLNLGASNAIFTIRGFDDRRTALFTNEVEVRAGGFLDLELAQLLADAQVTLTGGVTGYLEIDIRLKGGVPGASPTVWGVAGFRTSSGAYSVLPMVASGKTQEIFLHVAESADVRLFTGFSFYNPNAEQAQLAVTAFDSTGVQTATKAFDLAPGYRLVELLGNPALFGTGFTQVGGYIRVESTIPVVSFALFGDLRSHYLAAIQGQ